MFARPFVAESAPPPVPLSPRKAGINSPHAKHYKLFRTLPLSAQLPSTTALPHSYSAARPASAHAFNASPSQHGGSHSMPLTSVSPSSYGAQLGAEAFATPQRPPPAPRPPTSARSATHSAGSLASPRRRPGSAPRSARSGVVAQEYNAAFLAAIQERQQSEADRLTLFNRLQHLRATEERAERHIEATAAQIRAVRQSRERHAREAAERKANEDWFFAERARASQQLREQHAQRKAAFRQYKQDLKGMKRAQAALQRNEQQELLQHRAALVDESLQRAQVVRADLLERTRLFHERQRMRAAHDASRMLEAKAMKIELERARRAAAEDDLVRMEAEEAALLARAQHTALVHQRTLDELASLVLVPDVKPTLRASYAPMAELMNRSGRKLRKQPTQHHQAEAADSLQPAPQPLASESLSVDPLSSFSFSPPSAVVQHRINASDGNFASPVHSGSGHEEEKQQQQPQSHPFSPALDSEAEGGDLVSPLLSGSESTAASDDEAEVARIEALQLAESPGR